MRFTSRTGAKKSWPKREGDKHGRTKASRKKVTTGGRRQNWRPQHFVVTVNAHRQWGDPCVADKWTF